MHRPAPISSSLSTKYTMQLQTPSHRVSMIHTPASARSLQATIGPSPEQTPPKYTFSSPS
ncbi:hypothetical protein ACSS6W_008437 [Trichoderma asperelloides]